MRNCHSTPRCLSFGKACHRYPVRSTQSCTAWRYGHKWVNLCILVRFPLVLAVLGLAALAVPSFTYFTTERVADVRFFTADISRPHTIVFNPIVGGILLVAGIVLVLVGFRSSFA